MNHGPGEGYKLAVIGGGSSYTPELVEGLIARRSELPVREIVLVDVPAGRDKVAVICALSRRMLERAGLPAVVAATLDRRRAIDGADFVISQFRVGGLAARVKDETLPLGYDVVGQETTGPGGFAKALRTIPVALELARDIRELAPEAWLMNFTNPAGIVTEAITRHGRGTRVIGLCNVPISIQRAICRETKVEPYRVEIDVVGLNHLGWITAVRLDGQDILPLILTLPLVERQFVENIPGAIGIRPLLDALRMLPSPYLGYYYFTRELLAAEKEAVARGEGTRGERVMEVERDLLERYRDPNLTVQPPELAKRGGAYYSEAALDVMVSLAGRSEGPPEGPRNRHIVNVPNHRLTGDLQRATGCSAGAVLEGLSLEAVIETPSHVGAARPHHQGGGRPPAAGGRPAAARGPGSCPTSEGL
jgi:6-phospho-beta-glucosidase